MVKSRSGFTLLELLLVIAIISSLAGIIMMALNPAQRLEEANEVKSLSNAKDIEKALNAYVTENGGQFPTALQTKFNNGETRVDICVSGQVCNGVDLTSELVSGEYLNNIPEHSKYSTSTDSGYDIIYDSTTSAIRIIESPVFLLRDDFITDESSPISAPRIAEPGPGSWIVTDNANYISIANNSVFFGSTSTPARRLTTSTFSGQPGLALLQKFEYISGYPSVGFSSNNYSWIVNGSVSHAYSGYPITTSISIPLVLGKFYNLASVMTNSGRMVWLIKGEAYQQWSVYSTRQLTLSDQFFIRNSLDIAGSFRLRNSRFLVLPSPFNDTHSFSTSELSGIRNSGDVYIHEPNSVIEFIVTSIPSSGQIEFNFRMQDSLNYWQIRIDSSANLYLYEVVNNIATQRGTFSSTINNGDHIVIRAMGNKIQVFKPVNGSPYIAYSSASNFQSATDGNLATLGTGGVVSDIISWPYNVSGEAASVLDDASL